MGRIESGCQQYQLPQLRSDDVVGYLTKHNTGGGHPSRVEMRKVFIVIFISPVGVKLQLGKSGAQKLKSFTRAQANAGKSVEISY